MFRYRYALSVGTSTAIRGRAGLAPWDTVLCRVYSSAPSRTAVEGVKNTSPSSTEPSVSWKRRAKHDQGHLSFTKTSLFKLTLPLAPPSNDAISPSSKASSDSVRLQTSEQLRKEKEGEANDEEPWEQQVESGDAEESPSQSLKNVAEEEAGHKGPHSVIFLLHSAQPLSYIANLIRAEGPEANLAPETESSEAHDEHKSRFASTRKRDPTGDPPITFHTSLDSGKRWSPSTGIGDFLREAARVGSFTVAIGSRRVKVIVPSFEERTVYLRSSLHSKMIQIENMARLKNECDRMAHKATQRVAFAGAGIMGVWWVTVGVLTFKTSLGWDTMEPITYLTGLGTVISGYFWFLWHNREVSYRAVLTETTSRRQQKLYAERGFDIEAYQDLIQEAKELRKSIKRVASDYELEWDQGNTDMGQRSKKALDIVRKAEMKDKNGGSRKDEDKEDDEERERALAQVDDSEKPDKK
ncbi:hypothetical protein BOTBODRAFT_48115 [Botryobasidium botryosum FD-172 SS1]|uniref:Calcium uniporter protein, mitochondrial n=1 Tax=Botryobasidium botryosum (strain FD-172 SS1) TaxID=930990 RepID=A0A067M1R9_BOTB1|nr:hypothetical protein BOTBODRAFT_48115 [Botryobasidium botryosum FD-172 SS1]